MDNLKGTRMGGHDPFMSTNVQWQSFKLTEVDRAKIKNYHPMTYNIYYIKNTSFIALNETLNKRVVA